jgi:hypothetical protein
VGVAAGVAVGVGVTDGCGCEPVTVGASSTAGAIVVPSCCS